MSLIIAEAGVNHNGSIETAFKLIDAASDAGADIVKFQKYNTDLLATSNVDKAHYQKITTSKDISHYTMLKNLELSNESFVKIKDYCMSKGIELLLSVFDSESLNFAIEDLKVNKLKVASGELTNAPLLLQHSQKNCELIISTGMSNLNEIQGALEVISFGLLNNNHDDGTISRNNFKEAYESIAGKNELKKFVTLLHCVSEYPTDYADLNMLAMLTLKKKFSLNVGFSDHSLGILAPIVAASHGATIIEKHFTLDRSMEGPDHKASLTPDELKQMIQDVRSVKKIVGSEKKTPTKMEKANKDIVGKSLVALTEIKSGDKLTHSNIGVKRPGTGISPYFYWELIGTESKSDYKKDELIRIE
jgi:N-acetylneuraminate synthase